MAQGQVWTRRGRQKESCLVEMIIYGRKSLSPWLAAPSPGGPAFQSPRPCVEGKEGLSWACGGAWRPGVEPLAREQVYPRWGDPEGERARDQGWLPFVLVGRLGLQRTERTPPRLLSSEQALPGRQTPHQAELRFPAQTGPQCGKPGNRPGCTEQEAPRNLSGRVFTAASGQDPAGRGRSAIPGSPPRDTWVGETTRAPRPRTLAGLRSGGCEWAALSKTHDGLSRRSPRPRKKHKNCSGHEDPLPALGAHQALLPGPTLTGGLGHPRRCPQSPRRSRQDTSQEAPCRNALFSPTEPHCPPPFTDQRHRDGEGSAKGHTALRSKAGAKTWSLGSQPAWQMASHPQTQSGQPGCQPAAIDHDSVTPYLLSASTSSNSTPTKAE